MPVPIHQIVTFAKDPFRGNPAFVVTLDAPRPAEMMMALCRQLQEPVLAVLSDDGEQVELRYFTPEGPHPGAGHSTHAAAWVALNRLRPGASAIEFGLDGGGRRAARAEDGRISVDWPVMPLRPLDARDALADCLGSAPDETFDSSFGVIAVFADDTKVAALSPDLAKVARLSSDTVIVTAPSQSADFAIRVFAPRIGLNEDPVCGTAHRILVPFWADRLKRDTLVSHQLSPRGGILYCRLGEGIVTITGEATLFLDGTIALPS
ncbi:MAG: PhzF family phenazine biosynthesis protein [Bauldia sp.]